MQARVTQKKDDHVSSLKELRQGVMLKITFIKNQRENYTEKTLLKNKNFSFKASNT